MVNPLLFMLWITNCFLVGLIFRNLMLYIEEDLMYIFQPFSYANMDILYA